MIANSLREAYNNFDPLMPLPGNSEFYIERKKNPLRRIEWDLLNYDPSQNPIRPKLLFSGHRGSGKSTELKRLMVDTEVQSAYFIVEYSVRDVLDIAGLDYTDLLLSIGAQIFARAVEDKLKLRERLLTELNSWRGIVEKEAVIEEGAKLETEAGLNAFFIKVLSKLKLEYTNREKIRQTIEPRLPELINIINSVIVEVELQSEKRVLVVIDDIDKPDLEVARSLFCDHQTSLTQPNCSIIYTVPIGLLYSPDAGQVKQGFTDSYVLPNITITEYADRSRLDEEGCAMMRRFALKRMSPELIAEDALNYAVGLSGGVFREMARIIRTSVYSAYRRDAEKIEKEDMEEAESEIRNEFRRMLETEDYEALVEIYGSRKLRGSDVCAKLLHNLSILEYQNKENWCDVHPAVIPLIQEEQT